MTNAEAAAKLLRRAADLLRQSANENPGISEAIEVEARTMETVANRVEGDPKGNCTISI